MTWTRLSDDFADHPELLNASRSARMLHVEALIYGNRHGNDGRFRRQLVARMTDADDWPDLVDELVEHGIWTDDGNGSLTIDWASWEQEPAAKVQERRDENKKRQTAYQERQKRHAAGDHSTCTQNCPAVRNASSNGVSNSSDNTLTNGTPSRPSPSPSRPGGEGERERTGRRSETPPPRSAGAPRDAAVSPLRRPSSPPGLINPWELGEEPAVVVNGEDA